MMRALFIACLLAGCATVQPWEREQLSHRAMQSEVDDEGGAFEGHLQGARESALDPGSSGGGGCGCN